jgi:hypothetical protein
MAKLNRIIIIILKIGCYFFLDGGVVYKFNYLSGQAGYNLKD